MADLVVGGVCVAATIAALVLSYRNLLDFATHHGSPLWAAVAFPLIIDVFVVVGEGRLYSATRRDEGWWMKGRMWGLTLFGLAASMAGNWLHYQYAPLSWKIAAAAAPLCAAICLGVGLGLVKLHTRGQDTAPSEEPRPGAASRRRPASRAAKATRARRPAGTPDPGLVAKLIEDAGHGLPLSWRKVVERHGVTQYAAQKAIPAARAHSNGAG